MHRLLASLVCTALFSGCAGLRFGNQDAYVDKGLIFYDPVPYLLVNVGTDCVATTTVVAVPGKKRTVTIKNGWGSSETSLAFSGGLLTAVGQTTDSKIPETITSTATLLGAFTNIPGEGKTCEPSSRLYQVKDGVVGGYKDLLEPPPKP